MDCPKCGGRLLSREIGGAIVDQCENCHGIWLELGELPAIIAFHRQQSKPDVGPEGETVPVYDAISAPCPRCGGEGNMTRLTNLEDSSLIMDSCPVCYGIWLDGGELQKLMGQGSGFSVRNFLRNLFG